MPIAKAQRVDLSYLDSWTNFKTIHEQELCLYSIDHMPTAIRIRVQVVVVTNTHHVMLQMPCLVATWNLGNAPPDDNLSSWLPPEKVREAAMVVVGAQECEYVSQSICNTCEEDWIDAVSKALEVAGCGHVLVFAENLGHQRLLIFARLHLAAGITALTSDTVNTGTGRIMKNKGAVAIALWIWSTSIIFISSHLAAHQVTCKCSVKISYCENHYCLY